MSATEVTESVLDALHEHPERIAPHLHMPLQSGDDDVLRAMNRWYDVDTYVKRCDEIRERLDRPAFTADVLVGFPGEDAASFANTLATVERIGFARVHVFPFSARPGTAAAVPSQLGAPVDPMDARERRAALSETAHACGARYRAGLEGAEDVVVLEGGAGLSGRYQRVRVPLDSLPPGPLPDLCSVTLALDPEAPEDEPRLVGRPR